MKKMAILFVVCAFIGIVFGFVVNDMYSKKDKNDDNNATQEVNNFDEVTTYDVEKVDIMHDDDARIIKP